MEAFYGLPPATPVPRTSDLGSPDSPQCVVDFDAASLQVKKTSSRRASNSSLLSSKSGGSNQVSVSTTACLTVTSDDEAAPRRERRKTKVPSSRSKAREAAAAELENSQSAGLDTSEVDASSSVRSSRRTAKPKSSTSSSSRHNWMSTMGSGGDFSDTGSLAPRRSSSRRSKISDTVSLSAMSSAVSVQSETSDMGGSTASAMRKKKKKPSSRSMSQHSSTLSVGSLRSSRGGEDRLFSSASVGGRPRTSTSTKPSRRMSATESQSKNEDAAKAAIRAADRKVSRRLSTKGGRTKSALSSSNASRPSIKKSVSFDYVEVREYARVLSDNPAVRKGPPLGLDWDYIVSLCQGVEEYERKRGNRRSYNELQMPRYLREKLLEEHTDVTERELALCMREIKKIKRQRQQSVAFQDGAQVLLEKAGRGLKRIFQKKSNKKEEDELWESAKQFAILKMQQREMQDLAADVGDDDTVL